MLVLSVLSVIFLSIQNIQFPLLVDHGWFIGSGWDIAILHENITHCPIKSILFLPIDIVKVLYFILHLSKSTNGDIDFSLIYL